MTNIDFNHNMPPETVVSAPYLTLSLLHPPIQYYRHGWQSWSLAAWTDPRTPFPIQKPHLLHPMQNDPSYAFNSNPNGSWVGAVDTDLGNILLLGSLGMDAHVELRETHLSGLYESGTGDWFIGYGTETVVFSRYAELLGQRFGKTQQESAPNVWCSWYSLYTAIDEPLLTRVFDDLKDLPFDVLQVDDGWQIATGDWEANDKFPSGIASLANKIKLTGRKAGLWLAPLIAVKSSSLFRNHSDWFLKDLNHRFVSAGFNWGEQLFAIDTTHPEALAWLTKLMKQVRQWGFEYVKLDFLYGAALPGKRKIDMPREAAYRNGMKIIREGLGEDVFLLACGAPILPSLGLCDALRIGPDVASEWENTRDAVLLYNPTIPGTKNAIRTTTHRLWLNSVVHTDPDVVYFRSRDCKLTEEQKLLLQSLALICNFKASSDLPQWLTNSEKADLGDFLRANPKITHTSRYTYQINNQSIDLSSAMSFPAPPKGINLIESVITSWLGNKKWILRYIDKTQKNALLKKKKEFLI